MSRKGIHSIPSRPLNCKFLHSAATYSLKGYEMLFLNWLNFFRNIFFSPHTVAPTSQPLRFFQRKQPWTSFRRCRLEMSGTMLNCGDGMLMLGGLNCWTFQQATVMFYFKVPVELGWSCSI